MIYGGIAIPCWLSMFCENEYGVKSINLLGPLLHGLLIVGFVNISYGKVIMHIFSKLYSHNISQISNLKLSTSSFILLHHNQTHTRIQQLTKIVATVALVGSASAFAPAMNNRVTTHLNFEYGEYDDKLWDNDAKKDVYNKWDPTAARSSKNFNPFETFKGNSCDASGVYPGEVS